MAGSHLIVYDNETAYTEALNPSGALGSEGVALRIELHEVCSFTLSASEGEERPFDRCLTLGFEGGRRVHFFVASSRSIGSWVDDTLLGIMGSLEGKAGARPALPGISGVILAQTPRLPVHSCFGSLDHDGELAVYNDASHFQASRVPSASNDNSPPPTDLAHIANSDLWTTTSPGGTERLLSGASLFLRGRGQRSSPR